MRRYYYIITHYFQGFTPHPVPLGKGLPRSAYIGKTCGLPLCPDMDWIVLSFDLGKGAGKKTEKLSPFDKGGRRQTSNLEKHVFSVHVESF